MKLISAIATAAFVGATSLLIHSKPAEAGWFMNCTDLESNSFRSQRKICDGDFGERVIVECDSLGRSCVKLCTMGGLMDGC